MTIGELPMTDGNCSIMKTTTTKSIEKEMPQDMSNHITKKEKVTPLFNAIRSSRLVQLLRKSITMMPKKASKIKIYV